MAGIWAALSAIAFVYLLLLQLLKNLSMKKKSPPSPFGLPIIGHLHYLGKNPHQDLHRLARKHGPIMGFRLGFVSAVVVSSPAAAELILKTHDTVFASRPKIIAVDSVSYEQRNLVFAAHGPYWRNMRRLCTSELLNAARIAQFQAARSAEVRLLVSSLKSAAELGEIVDLSARATGLSADMNCMMVFGRKYDDSDLGEMGFQSVFMETAEISAKFNLADYFPYIGVLDLQGLTSRIKELGKVFDEFLEKIIDDHLQEKPEKKETKDFVDTMMAVMDSGEAGFEFDRRHVKAVLQDMLIAGTDTPSTSVEWAISELTRHPSVMKKLQKELESTVGLNYMVEESHLEKLEYLDFVVKETLRLHPPPPLLIPRESMEDCTINGIFHIPKKSRAIVNVWAIGRDPNTWAQPETFWPERFAGSEIKYSTTTNSLFLFYFILCIPFLGLGSKFVRARRFTIRAPPFEALAKADFLDPIRYLSRLHNSVGRWRSDALCLYPVSCLALCVTLVYVRRPTNYFAGVFSFCEYFTYSKDTNE